MASRIFINYRRDDSLATAGRLHDRLAAAFGAGNVFMDVDHIPAGVDFHTHLEAQITSCDLVLVLIGPHWLKAADADGQRRIDKPDDFVGLEIAAALARNVRVIPVLIDGAQIPRAEELPVPLRPLVRRHAVEVRNVQFGSDVQRLIEKVREAVPHSRPWSHVLPALAAAVVLLAAALLYFIVPLSTLRTRFLVTQVPKPKTTTEVPQIKKSTPHITATTAKPISRIRLRQAVLVRAGDVDWYWIETDPRTNKEAQFNFRQMESSDTELTPYDASRQMYARLNFADRRAYWRIGETGDWKWNYDILAVE